MNRQPLFKKMLANDYTVLLTFVTPIALWVFFLLVFFLDDSSIISTNVPLIFGALTVMAVAVLVWRMRVINAIFEDGIETPGTITRIWFYRGRGSVNYSYAFQGQEYKSGNAVMRSKQTREIVIGQPVTLIVDPSNPKRALIRDLYI